MKNETLEPHVTVNATETSHNNVMDTNKSKASISKTLSNTHTCEQQTLLAEPPTRLACLTIAAGLLVIASLACPAQSLVSCINFDTFPDGSAVGNGTIIVSQYKNAGAVFSSVNGGPQAVVGLGEANSVPNFLVGNPDSFTPIAVDIVDPSTGLPSTAQSVTAVLISVGNATVTASASAADLTTLLDSVSVSNPGTGVGLQKKNPITLNGPGIARVTFTITVPYPGDGFGIDDLCIEFVSNHDPICNAGLGQTIEMQGTLTRVQLDGSASSDPDGDTLTFEWAVPDSSGTMLDDPSSPTPIGMFPLGPSLVTLTVTDGNGGLSVCDVLITIQDTTPPVVVCTTDVIALWPPNHEMTTVTITLHASDATAVGDLIVSCEVSSNEPDDSNGEGAFTGDVNGQDGYTSPVPVALTLNSQQNAFVGTVDLRAERDGAQSGRTYSIVCTVTDAAGNANTASCVVVVPHDRRK